MKIRIILFALIFNSSCSTSPKKREINFDKWVLSANSGRVFPFKLDDQFLYIKGCGANKSKVDHVFVNDCEGPLSIIPRDVFEFGTLRHSIIDFISKEKRVPSSKMARLLDLNEVALSDDDIDAVWVRAIEIMDPYVARPCGLSGMLDERIEDCKKYQNHPEKGFVLVARTNDYLEIFHDQKNNLLWSHRLFESMEQNAAVTACESDFISDLDLSNETWEVPRPSEYESLSTPFKDVYWTASSLAYNGLSERIEKLDTKKRLSVRCVHRLPASLK